MTALVNALQRSALVVALVLVPAALVVRLRFQSPKKAQAGGVSYRSCGATFPSAVARPNQAPPEVGWGSKAVQAACQP